MGRPPPLSSSLCLFPRRRRRLLAPVDETEPGCVSPGLILSPLLPPRLSSIVLSSPGGRACLDLFCLLLAGCWVAEVGDKSEGEGDGVPAGAAQSEGGARGEPGHLRPPHPQQRPLRRPPPRPAGNKPTLCSHSRRLPLALAMAYTKPPRHKRNVYYPLLQNIKDFSFYHESNFSNFNQNYEKIH